MEEKQSLPELLRRLLVRAVLLLVGRLQLVDAGLQLRRRGVALVKLAVNQLNLVSVMSDVQVVRPNRLVAHHNLFDVVNR